MLLQSDAICPRSDVGPQYRAATNSHGVSIVVVSGATKLPRTGADARSAVVITAKNNTAAHSLAYIWKPHGPVPPTSCGVGGDQGNDVASVPCSLGRLLSPQFSSRRGGPSSAASATAHCEILCAGPQPSILMPSRPNKAKAEISAWTLPPEGLGSRPHRFHSAAAQLQLLPYQSSFSPCACVAADSAVRLGKRNGPTTGVPAASW